MRRLGIGLFLGVLSLVCLPVLVAAQVKKQQSKK
jgi:hypothetical protein